MNSNKTMDGKFATHQHTASGYKAGDKVRISGVGEGVVSSVTPHTINVQVEVNGVVTRTAYPAHQVQPA